MLAKLNYIEDYACRFLLGLFVILLFVQVVMRVTLGIGMAWIEELARYAFVWFVFLGAAHAAHLSAHNRLQTHIKLMPRKVANTLLLLVDLIWVAFCLVLAYKSLDLIGLLLEFPYDSPALGWSLAYVYFVFPIAFTLMAFRVLQVQCLKLFKGIEPGDVDAQEVSRITEETSHYSDGKTSSKAEG
ncbi:MULTISPECIES: TRAP transporter small permease [unclassified Halomonas]|uniref:TRAP transporter small permease n=1 Tax=unclassified Halomonas TaxID=2609666 RepID=UPI0005F9B9E9|nr:MULTISPECIES: TRAP transporter small permease [unclassified Halomonas]MCO7217500.1 TRAP transporter small permease [Halomonas sp. OfavH-34-E]RQW68974.1 TRAP transporter small permease [Halomonas sp. YLB-10]